MNRETAKTLKVPSFVPVLNPLIKAFLRIGVPMGPNTLLCVRGRKSGKMRTTPVGLMEHGGHRYLFATFGEVDWVRNLRASGEAKIGMGRHREMISATVLNPEKAAAVFREVLKPYLHSRMMRSFLHMGYELGPNSTDEDFMNEALRHPVFEVSPEKKKL
jgi:deazaflavin-dependent oxidoreductase (nitroreductase family)